MNDKITLIEKPAKQTYLFLLCDTSGKYGEGLSLSGREWIQSPIQCLEKSISENPDIILIRFWNMPVRGREALVELCGALKRSRQGCPILAILHSKHRILIEDLKKANIDYIKYMSDAKPNSSQVLKIIENLGSNDHLDRHLKMICPFLRYSVIDSQQELTLCGAYLERMVLGGCRLHEIYEIETHLHCEYYMNPRLKT